eukprot:GILJ01006586.1.p1 GENE.GILJ01006586.1~~GILJ01006586.1.p1  ORF type:complete len:278 (+),score=13.17 GILJ01006586.1:73-906(+)
MGATCFFFFHCICSAFPLCLGASCCRLSSTTMSSVEDWYKEIPIITRCYMTVAFLTTVACAVDLVSPFALYFNRSLIFEKFQVWRLITNFFFFGTFGLDFLFHMFFLVRYSRLLEETSFRGRTADFFYMLLFGATIMTLMQPLININFLGSSLTFMMVYVWARRNPHAHMSFLEIFNFTAPYLPWVLLTFSFLLGSDFKTDLIGIAVGHTYYFLEDVYPLMPNSRDRRLLKTPNWILSLFGVPLRVPATRADVNAAPTNEAAANAQPQPQLEHPHEQ